MSISDNKFRVYLVFEDRSSYGVSLCKDITYDGLVSFVEKKFKLKNAYVLSFSYKMPHGAVHIVDDDDVAFFVNEVCRPKAAIPKLLIKMVVKNVKVNPCSSNCLDFDLNDSLFHDDFEPYAFYNNAQIPQNEFFNTSLPKNEPFDIDYQIQQNVFVNTSNLPKNEPFVNFGPTFPSNDQFVHKWETNTFEYMPCPPDPPMPNIKIPNNIIYNNNSSCILYKGQEFDNKDLCMYAIGKKALTDGYEFKVRKSDKKRYDVICKNKDCEWKIVSSKLKNSVKWELGKVYDVHTCPKTQFFPNHCNATKKFLGRFLAPKLRDKSRIYTPKDIQEDIAQEFKIDISYKKAWGGKNRALEMLSGDPTESFHQLPYYCHNLKLANDGTVTHIDTDNEGHFKMCFIAFGVAVSMCILFMR